MNKSIPVAATCAALFSGIVSTGARATTAEISIFGELPDKSVVQAITLADGNGTSAVIITYGATLQAFNVPDRNGEPADITLGHDTLEDYLAQPNYWGQTIGRYANRIANGQFSLDGKTYMLTRNDAENSLHGGTEGFDKRNWTIVSVTQGQTASVTMALTSPDGDQGFPGTVRATVTYTLDDHGALTIDHYATTDAPTVVNLTNHALFNLAGEGASGGTHGHRLTIAASHYLPVDQHLIPTGELRQVAGTVFDFREGRALSDGVREGTEPQIAMGRGWDHNWVLDKGQTAEPEFAARLEDPASGRVLEVLTTEPGLQFYSGNFLDGTLIGKCGHIYRMGDGIALEPQKFPDTPNQPEFGSARLDPDQEYRHRMILRVSVDGKKADEE